MVSGVDLAAYFARIQWSGGTSPTLQTLAGLIHAHTRRIPFENLDVLLGRQVRLDLPGLQDKLIHAGRGGYCFEHATLFAAMLEALGFQPVRHAGRVVLFEPRTAASRGHMFLTVPLDGMLYVVDPGFGPFGPRFPVPLSQHPANEATHWMAREGSWWVLHTTRDGKAAPGWMSTLEHENLVDFEMANHFTATHASSPFVNGIMLSAATPDGRVNVMNRDVTIRHGREEERHRLADRTELRALLATWFGFDLPEVEGMVVPAVPEWR